MVTTQITRTDINTVINKVTVTDNLVTCIHNVAICIGLEKHSTGHEGMEEALYLSAIAQHITRVSKITWNKQLHKLTWHLETPRNTKVTLSENNTTTTVLRPLSVTIRYDTRYYFNVRSKADISQLNLPHGTDN